MRMKRPRPQARGTAAATAGNVRSDVIMSIEKLLKHLEKDNTVIGGTDAGEVLDLLADEAMRITAELNNSYHLSLIHI